jgi:hypothetical protein
METREPWKSNLNSKKEIYLTSQQFGSLFVILIFLFGNLCFGIYIFSTGFFPVKTTLPGYSANPPVHKFLNTDIFQLYCTTHENLYFFFRKSSQSLIV